MKLLVLFLFLSIVFHGFVPLAAAIEDPLKVSNNRFGIHILFDAELDEAAKLVNSQGGDWGYVTIPIQVNDRDLEKWQNFMDKARDLHLIPIIRLATEIDYFNNKSWRKPTDADIVDFANFLNSLNWPVKNRYVIVFNETNRADEWGGSANPEEYAHILTFAVETFKKSHPDFFMISGGLDNAAPQKPPEYIDQYLYMKQMTLAVPDVFSAVDGISSHSYPNPGFSQPPSVNTTKSIASFTYERKLIKQLSGKELPVFITETGWTSETITDEQRAKYYDTALKSVWADAGIVAITPFLLKATGPFGKFSFITDAGEETKQYEKIQDMPKVKGLPTFNAKDFTSEIKNVPPPSETRTYVSGMHMEKESTVSTTSVLTSAFKWIFKI